MKTTRTYLAKCNSCNGTGVDYKQIIHYDTSAVCIVCNGAKVITVTETFDEPVAVDIREELKKFAMWFTHGEIDANGSVDEYLANRPSNEVTDEMIEKWIKKMLFEHRSWFDEETARETLKAMRDGKISKT